MHWKLILESRNRANDYTVASCDADTAGVAMEKLLPEMEMLGHEDISKWTRGTEIDEKRPGVLYNAPEEDGRRLWLCPVPPIEERIRSLGGLVERLNDRLTDLNVPAEVFGEISLSCREMRTPDEVLRLKHQEFGEAYLFLEWNARHAQYYHSGCAVEHMWPEVLLEELLGEAYLRYMRHQEALRRRGYVLSTVKDMLYIGIPGEAEKLLAVAEERNGLLRAHHDENVETVRRAIHFVLTETAHNWGWYVEDGTGKSLYFFSCYKDAKGRERLYANCGAIDHGNGVLVIHT